MQFLTEPSLSFINFLDGEAALRRSLSITLLLHLSLRNLSDKSFSEPTHLGMFGNSLGKRTTRAADDQLIIFSFDSGRPAQSL